MCVNEVIACVCVWSECVFGHVCKGECVCVNVQVCMWLRVCECERVCVCVCVVRDHDVMMMIVLQLPGMIDPFDNCQPMREPSAIPPSPPTLMPPLPSPPPGGGSVWGVA